MDDGNKMDREEKQQRVGSWWGWENHQVSQDRRHMRGLFRNLVGKDASGMNQVVMDMQ